MNTFTILRVIDIPEYNLQATELVSKETGLHVLKLFPSDPAYTEATFDIAFTTPSTSSTGVQHITEHSVLCGSKSFRLKEPFQVLLQSSLQTYLNAGTYSDHTVYPFATRTEQDFYNIMEIYADAVFSPLIHESDLIFQQEGHHLEINEGVLTENGVVYNEMKGAFSDPSRVGGSKVQELLFPEGAMRFESGGYPSEIKKLTAQDLREFHKEHYTTDNGYVVLVSRYPLDKELEIIRKYSLCAFRGKYIEVQRTTAKVSVTHEMEFGAQKPDEPEIYENGFRLYDNDAVDIKEFVALNIIDDLIHDAPASPFKKPLGGSFSSSLDYSQRQCIITLTCTGSKLGFAEYQRKMTEIYNWLAGAESDYLQLDQITASMNKYQFKLQEIKDFHGINLANKVFLGWIYGTPFEKFLAQSSAIEGLKAMKEEIIPYLKGLIAKYFVDVGVALRMKPVVGLSEQQDKEQEAAFKAVYDSLTEEEREKIIKNQEIVKSRQKQHDAPEAIKSVKQLQPKDLANIGDSIASLAGSTTTLQNASFFEFESKQDKIVYVDVFFDITDGVTTEVVQYASLLAFTLNKVPTKKYPTVSLLNQAVDSLLGSFRTGVRVDDTDNGARVLVQASYKCLTSLAAEASQLVNEIVLHSQITPELLQQLSDEKYNELKDSLASRLAHTIAANRALAKYSPSMATYDYHQGLGMLKFLKSSIILKKLNKLQQQLAFSAPILFALSCSKQHVEEQKKILLAGFKELGFTAERQFKRTPQIHSELHAEVQKSVAATVNVNYVAVGYDHKRTVHSPALMLMDTILSKSYLWDNVRVMGGAYGCFIVTTLKMQQYIVSYRDPELAKTLETYRKVPEYIRTLKFEGDQLYKLKIGALGQRQKSIAPESRFSSALGYFFDEVSPKAHADLVNQIINITVEQLQETAEVYEKMLGNVVVFGRAADVKGFAGDDVDVL